MPLVFFILEGEDMGFGNKEGTNIEKVGQTEGITRHTQDVKAVVLYVHMNRLPSHNRVNDKKGMNGVRVLSKGEDSIRCL